MLQNLLAAADWNSSFVPQFKLRALRALKHIFRGLTTKRFVAEPVAMQGGGVMGKLGFFWQHVFCMQAGA